MSVVVGLHYVVGVNHRFFVRMMRSIPIAGIALQGALWNRRLHSAREEDAAYRRTMFELGESAKFAGASESQERFVLSGELLGHVVVCGSGAVAYLLYGAPWLVLLAAWPVAFVADWLGGRLAVMLFERKQPTVDTILEDVQRDPSE